MLAVILWVALFGYAVAYGGVAKIVTGTAPGLLESLSPTFAGVLLVPGVKGKGTGTGTAPAIGPGGTPPAGSGQATPAIRTILGALGSIPGWSLGRICGPGSVSASEHPYCNAADISGGRSILFLVQTALVAAGKSGALPIHCVIGPSTNPAWEKGQIRSRESSWRASEYTGPNSHQTHVHVSGWPSVGGGC